MELRQLEYFVAVAEEASFTRAALRLHVAQPGVSAQIRQLERELGQDLFDRSARRVALTDVGATVLGYARAALDAAAGARTAVDEMTGLLRGRVSIGMVIACTSLDLANLLAGFHADHPGVEMALSEGGSDELIGGVRDGRLDLAFIGLAGVVPAGIEIREVADEPLVAVVAPSDALASRRSIPLGELVGRPLIGLPAGTGIRAALDEACSAVGLDLRIGLEASSPGTVALLAARGLGVGVVPLSVAKARQDELATLEIDGPAVRARLALAWRPGAPTGPAARALIERARTGAWHRRRKARAHPA